MIYDNILEAIQWNNVSIKKSEYDLHVLAWKYI